MQIDKYLERIKTKASKHIDFSFLDTLHKNHLLSVPFENLDVRLGREIKLNVDSLFNKVISQNRGGLCFELNYLFAWLLAELGFQVRIAASSVYDSEINRFEDGFDHMVLLVQLDQKYLVDVGFGDCFRSPVSLSGDPTEDISGKYRVYNLNQSDEYYFLQKQDQSEWKYVYKFSTENREAKDFYRYLNHVTTSPQSYHKIHTLCSIATVSGRVTLTDQNLTMTNNGTKIKSEITTDEEFINCLDHYFSINVPGLNKLLQLMFTTRRSCS